MTVTNDMTIALLNTVIFTPVTLIVRVSDRRDFTPQGTLSCGNTIDQNGRSRLYHQRCRQGSPCPSAFSCYRGQIRQWRSSPASTLAQSITAHAFGETVCHHAAGVDPSHHVGLVRTNLFSQFSIKSKPDHVTQRSQIDTESLVAALRRRGITKVVAK